MAINTQCLANIPHLICKNNLQTMVSIVNIFHNLSNANIGRDKFTRNILVKFTELFFRNFAISTNECKRRIHVILNSSSFTQELRIRHNSESFTTLLTRCLRDDFSNFSIRSRKNSAADCHNMKIVFITHCFTNLAGNLVDILQIQMTFLAARCSNNNKRNFRVMYCIMIVHCSFKQSFIVSLFAQLINFCLNDSRTSLINQIHLIL